MFFDQLCSPILERVGEWAKGLMAGNMLLAQLVANRGTF
jgi:hypothetical protein